MNANINAFKGYKYDELQIQGSTDLKKQMNTSTFINVYWERERVSKEIKSTNFTDQRENQWKDNKSSFQVVEIILGLNKKVLLKKTMWEWH